MNEFTDIHKPIASRVRSFCNDLIDGRLSKEVEAKYNIPSDYIDICKDSCHPSSKKLNARFFDT